MSQWYNNTKSEDTKLGILKMYAFCQKIKQRVWRPGESAAGVIYLSMRIHPKSCCIFCLKVVATSFNGSRKGAVGV